MTAQPKVKQRYTRRTWIQGVVITLLAFLASLGIGESIVGQTLGRVSLDLLTRRNTPIDEDQIVLIDITENDYNNLFAKTRPLSPAKIVDLIRAAHKGGAKLIAVDISTADWPQDWQQHSEKLPSSAAIVWARGFYRDPWDRRARYRLEPLLGAADPGDECYGVPALGEDGGVVRTFYSGLQVGERSEPSFISQIVYRSNHQSCLKEDDAQAKLAIIAFSSRIRVESASTLLAEFKQKDWNGKPLYGDKIVILGGSFHSGSDIVDTPVGVKSGLEIIGQAVSCVIRNNARTELGEWTSIWIDLLLGSVLLLFGVFGLRVQAIVTAIALALSIAFSLILFRQYYLFVSFLPFVVGIIAHLVLEWLHRREKAPEAGHPETAKSTAAATA
jgi:hypothetical protein